MLKLTFGGWVECRLATDPDPSDERWGVSGYVRAYSGEPPLDRIVQTNGAEAVQRPLSPKVGLSVQAVELNGVKQDAHVLLGAPVNFAGSPVFEGRNDLVAPDTIEPILPMIIEIEREKLKVRRELRDLSDGSLLSVRAPGTQARFEMLEESGIGDPKDFLEKRISNLEALEADAAGLVAKKDRLSRLYRARARADQSGRPIMATTGGPVPLFVGMTWRYIFQGPWWEVSDPAGVLNPNIAGGAWAMDLWMGCWDSDVLCAYAKGSLELPTLTENALVA
ncbi:hypothetical protein [uncultured Roseobacter sp.]|uniref:hypothetical protein n=1 Tax=uncultured Roseobacter sp. TaxID=114847 RepID=UPI002623C48B|nr:hypothetical protein [uncultured Roseobacter sp.]